MFQGDSQPSTGTPKSFAIAWLFQFTSLLFGSLLNVNKVIAPNTQTDLQYCVDNLPDYVGKKNLIKRSKQCHATWSKYNKIVNVLNEDVIYYVWCKGTQNCRKGKDLVNHGDYHYDEIKHCPNVNKFDSRNDVIPLIEKFLEETS